jgi:uncharacterized integral membrane protein
LTGLDCKSIERGGAELGVIPDIVEIEQRRMAFRDVAQPMNGWFGPRAKSDGKIRSSVVFNKKALLYSMVVAALLAVLIASLVHFFFANWARENPLILAIIVGALCGPIYVVMARRRT